MGAKSSTLVLTLEEIANISYETGFDPSQVERLYERFCNLDKEDKGYLEHDDLAQVAEITRNPFGERIIQIFMSESRKGKLDFITFVRSMARFLPVSKYTRDLDLNSRQEKLRFLYKIYDLDDEGKISQNQLIALLLLMLGETLEPEKAKEMAEKIFDEVGATNEGFISLAQFETALEKTDIEQKLSLRFLH